MPGYRLWSITCCLAAAMACKSNGPDTVEPTDSGAGGDENNLGTGTPPAPYNQLRLPGAWTVADIEVDNPTNVGGYQGKLLRANDGTLYYAYYKFMGQAPGACDIAVFGGGSTPAPRYDLKVAVLPNGSSTWGVERVPLENAGGGAQAFSTFLYGIDGLIMPNGNLVLSVAAGDDGLFVCGSTQTVVATRTPGGTWSFQIAGNNSADCCPVCVPTAADLACCQDVNCTNADPGDVGAWAAVAVNGSGQLAVAYTDSHNTVDLDGTTYQGLELWEQAGGFSGIRPWSGFGAYASMMFVQGQPMIAFAGYKPSGVYIGRRTGNAGPASGTDWTVANIRPGSKPGERLSLRQAPNGNIGIAMHIRTDSTGATVNDLLFCESTDNGETWIAPCDYVDLRNAHLGQNPSLTFDSQSRPAISYYVCGASASCSPTADGLRYAWRDDTHKWWTFNVHFDSSTLSGQFSSLVLDPATDEPIIAFQDLTRGAAMIARGSFSVGAD